jgi:hypothetical protein
MARTTRANMLGRLARAAVLPEGRDLLLLERFFVLEELRDRGGEDVRVATVAGYGLAPLVTPVTRRPSPPRYPGVVRAASTGPEQHEGVDHDPDAG